MKATEYYSKHRDALASHDEKVIVGAISDLVIEMSNETKELIQRRHIKTDSGAVAVIREMNQKYNAVVRMFFKEFGASPIKPNGFRTYWENEIPQLRGKL